MHIYDDVDDDNFDSDVVIHDNNDDDDNGDDSDNDGDSEDSDDDDDYDNNNDHDYNVEDNCISLYQYFICVLVLEMPSKR